MQKLNDVWREQRLTSGSQKIARQGSIPLRPVHLEPLHVQDQIKKPPPVVHALVHALTKLPDELSEHSRVALNQAPVASRHLRYSWCALIENDYAAAARAALTTPVRMRGSRTHARSKVGVAIASHSAKMKYCSTRGGVKGVSFSEVLLSNYAPDGGLYVPENLPRIGRETLRSWAALGYQELLQEIFSLFVSPEELTPQEMQS